MDLTTRKFRLTNKSVTKLTNYRGKLKMTNYCANGFDQLGSSD